MKFLNLIGAVIGTAALTTGLIYLSDKKEVEIPSRVEVKVVTAGLQQSISPPIKNVDVQFKTILVDPSSDTVISFPNGTTIEIPEGAFIDKDGNPVSDNVTIKYREFHTPGDVIASGIPMKYDSAGVVGDFESAGMFEIRGTAKGEEVFIGDKPLAVNLASFKGGSFNQYRLNDDENNWTYLGTSEPKINLNRERSRKELKKAEADLRQNLYKPRNIKKAGKLFSMDIKKSQGTLTPYLNSGIQPYWEFISSNVPGGYKALVKMTKDLYKDISVKMDSSRIATIKITDKKDNKFIIRTKPVFIGDEFTRANSIYNKLEVSFSKKNKRIKALQSNFKAFGNFQRLMVADGFGIYNCDRPIKISFSDQITLRLLKDGLPIEGTYCLVTKKGIVNYYATTGRAFNVPVRKDGKGLFVTFDEEGSLLYADKENIKKSLDAYEGFSTIGGIATLSIEVKQIPYNITSPKMLNKVINELIDLSYSRS